MDTTPVNVLFCITWSTLQSYLVTGIPFMALQNIPTPYAVPHQHGPRPTPRTLLLSNSDSNIPALHDMCPTPIPIINRSVSCDQPNTRRLELSDDQLKQVLAGEGGHYVTDYMANSDDEARQNFKNLISLNDLYKDWSWDISLTKQTLLSQLEASYTKYYATTTSLHDLQSSQDINRDRNETDAEDILREYRDEENPENVKTVELPNLVLEDANRWHEIKVNVPLHILTKLVPAQYASPDHKRQQRDADGTTSRMEYCLNPHTQTSDGHYHLCPACAHTTTLGPDHFPRIINEIWCNANNKGCLHVGGAAHGSCRQSVFQMTMLRKKPNSCMTVIKDGRQYITDEWERYSQDIKLGCECMVNKISPFAAEFVQP